jgi:hypothetical protein
MKRRTAGRVALGIGAISIGACASHDYPPAAPTSIATRTSAADAVNQIAAGRCQRDERCHAWNDNENADFERCNTYVKTELDKSFGDRSNCKNGVATNDLDGCLAQIRGKECGFRGDVMEGIQTSMACSTRHLCLR